MTNPPEIVGAGEYGATRVAVTTDGSMVRIAFGRSGPNDRAVYHGAVLLSPEAVEQLKAQLATLGE